MQSKESNEAQNEQEFESEDSADDGKTKVNFAELEAKRAIESQLVTFQTQNDSKLEQFVSETRDFLKYLFDNYSAMFLFQRAYCLSDFYECCPEKIL